MAKSLEQLEKDVSATVKLVLSEMEQLAAMPPELAQERLVLVRRVVLRKIWTLHKETVAHGNAASV